MGSGWAWIKTVSWALVLANYLTYLSPYLVTNAQRFFGRVSIEATLRGSMDDPKPSGM